MAQSKALEILSKKKEAEDGETAVAEQPEAQADEPATPKKAAPKGSTVTETKTATKSVSDEIADTASTIENMTEPTAFKELHEMLHAQAFDEFRMGGILAKIQTENWFGEHPNFRSLVEAEFGIKYRTAMLWVAMYNDLVESGVAWTKLKRLGWTKISLLSGILTTDNVDEVLKTVDGMNAMQIQAYVAEFNKGNATSTSVPSDVSELKSKTFKLFPGQKESVELAIEKAKKETGTDSDSAALEYISVDFMSGTKKPKASASASTGDESAVSAAALPTTMAEFVPVFQNVREKAEDLQTGLTEILQAINEVFPEAQISVELEEPATA